MGHISEDRIEEVRSRIDLVQLVAEYVTLRKTGRNHLGLCPFHQEKTPSFTVSADKQIFYCFGCGEGGDAVTFLMKVNHLTFPEALHALAAKAGVVLSEREMTPAEKARRGQREGIYGANEAAAVFFQRTLASPAGRTARDYLEGRGISAEAVQHFRLGYAPDGWGGLRDHLVRAKLPLHLAEQAGLLVPRAERRGPGDLYDRFRGRLMFPVAEAGGRIVAFGGRVIGEGEPKYLNSPESPVYVKGRHLYGLALTRDEIRREGFSVLVEGYVDLISLWDAGMRHVVATLGTALTEEQVLLLRRYAKRVVATFDPDEAGRKALQRSLPIFLSARMDARALVLPGGDDPDRYVRRFGKQAFEERVGEARSLVDYYIEEIVGRRDTMEEQRDALKEAVSFIVRIGDDIERNLFIKRVSEKIGVDQEALKGEIRRLLPVRDNPPPVNTGGVRADGVDAVELSLLHIMVEQPERIAGFRDSGILSFFRSRDLRAAGEALVASWKQTGSSGWRASAFVDGLPEGPVKKRLVRCLVEGLPHAVAILDRLVADADRRIRQRWFRRRHEDLRIDLLRSEENGDRVLCERLLHEKEKLLQAEKDALGTDRGRG